ncbi:formate dehydrogenase [Rhodoferax sp.]|uniref:formate dehydrogenase n=1 Tax=Rhodoferax sp. TaxID=50421 RepID=UPI00276B4809|nr:formate dehydrogenase [Rhodoferax sp.]
MNQPPNKLSRRTLFAGMGTVGAIAATASLVPGVRQIEAAPAAPKVAPERGGGYTLSEHVKQYYKTTLV